MKNVKGFRGIPGTRVAGRPGLAQCVFEGLY